MDFIKFIKRPKPYFNTSFYLIKNFIRSYLYKGTAVFCEICDWHGKQFFEQKCPNCNSLPRTRLVPYALRYFNLINENPKILHIAPNFNEFKYIKKSVTILSNYDRLNIRNVKHINIVQDLTKTSLVSAQYDVVIAWHVLEHIPEDLKAIKEVYRLLKPKGVFLVSVPIFPKGNKITFEDKNIPFTDFEKIHGHYDHCRSCGLDYFIRFERVGFKTKMLKVTEFSNEIKTKFGLRDDHVVWCFIK